MSELREERDAAHLKAAEAKAALAKNQEWIQRLGKREEALTNELEEARKQCDAR